MISNDHSKIQNLTLKSPRNDEWVLTSCLCFFFSGGGGSGRTLREVSLDTPIRYGANDPVESWLYRLLCLDSKVGPHSRLLVMMVIFYCVTGGGGGDGEFSRVLESIPTSCFFLVCDL